MTARTLSLSEFLLARINDDEAAARRAADGPFSITSTPYGETFDIVTAGGGDYLEEQWFAVDPGRLLAECKAKRAIVELVEVGMGDCGIDGASVPRIEHYTGLTLLRAFAAVYVAHPDYDPDWA